MRNVVVIIIAIFLAIVFFGPKMQNQKTKKAFEVYMNEPLTVTGIDITITDVKEAKQLKKFKAKNTFLQTFVTVKNKNSKSTYLPHTMALVHRQDSKWICLLDNRFKNGLEKTEYLAGGYVLDPGQEVKAQIIFDCDAYLNDKAGNRKSKPADFMFFINSKEKKDGGYIFLEKRP